MPCRLTRTLSFEDGALRIDYRLANEGDRPAPYLWCAHPLVAIEPGMTLGIPAGTPMRVAGIVGGTEGLSGFEWPHAARISGPFRDSGYTAAAGFRPFAIKMYHRVTRWTR